MKSLLILLLMLALTGCGADTEETRIPTTEAPAVVTEPAGSYAPGSTLEMFTGGAVREYPQQIPDIYALAAAGEDVLVFSGWNGCTVTRLTGENLFRVAEITLDEILIPGEPGLLITGDRMVYFDSASRELVWLDESFREFSRLKMPEDMTGKPLITRDRLNVFYCTAEGLRVLDVESGISRLVKQMAYPEQILVGMLLEDSVVKLHILDEGSRERELFLDAETGQLLEEVEGVASIYSCGGLYYGYRMETEDMAVIVGKAGEATRELTPLDPQSVLTMLHQTGGAVTYSDREDRWQLEYYDLATGHRQAQVYLPEPVTPWQYAQAESGKFLYFLSNGDAESQIIGRWNLEMSTTGDEKIYTDTWYTRENPNIKGLDQCAARAAALSDQYGLEIHVYEDACAVQPTDYRLDVCWQVPVMEQQLDRLEVMLAALPENFLPLTMEKLGGKFHLSLVGSIRGSQEYGSLDSANGLQFWVEDDSYIALVPAKTFETHFYHELFHVMEARILSCSSALYRWDELNPAGFEYDYDYIANQNRDGSQYTQDNATRSFIDAYSMSFPKEDRARIFEHACRAGNEDLFLSATMQGKLRAICQGIREAYGLKKSEEVFPWERYLESSLAYVKK